MATLDFLVRNEVFVKAEIGRIYWPCKGAIILKGVQNTIQLDYYQKDQSFLLALVQAGSDDIILRIERVSYFKYEYSWIPPLDLLDSIEYKLRIIDDDFLDYCESSPFFVVDATHHHIPTIDLSGIEQLCLPSENIARCQYPWMFGTIWTQSLGSSRDIQIKVFSMRNQPLSQRNRYMEAIKAELTVLSCCYRQHHYLQQIEALFIDQHKFQGVAIALENLDVSLFHFLHEMDKSGRVIDFAGFALQIIDSLRFLNEKGIVLPFISSKSIFMRDETTGPVCVLCDFSCAVFPNKRGVVEEEKTAFSLSNLTNFRWIDPEILSGFVTSKSVIFSFGVILCELTTSGIPFVNFNDIMVINLLSNVYETTPYSHDEIAADVYDLVMACWSRDQRQRPSLQYLYDEIENHRPHINTLWSPFLSFDDGYIAKGLGSEDTQDLVPRGVSSSQSSQYQQEQSSHHQQEQHQEDEPNIEIPKYTANDFEFQRSVFDSEIGKGSFSVVYQAMKDGMLVALKMQRRRDNHREILFREMKYIFQFQHENIVSAYGFYENEHECSKPTIFGIVFELAQLGSLEDYCSLSYDIKGHDMITIAIDMANALNFLHEKGMIHCDFKPGNVLVFRRNPSNLLCKVADLGTLKRGREIIFHDHQVGTCLFMAPEVTISSLFSTKCDVFGYAVTLWFITTRCLPYKALLQNAIQELVAGRVANENLRPEIFQWFPVQWSKIMVSCWQHDYSLRPSFATLLGLSETTNGGENLSLQEISASLFDDSFFLHQSEYKSQQALISRPSEILIPTNSCDSLQES